MLFQWITTAGLALDILGASFLAWGLFVTKKKAADLGVGYYADGGLERQLKLPPVADRLRQSRNAMIGLPILLAGFVLQIVGTWAQPAG